MVKFTFYQLLSLVDHGVDIHSWEAFEQKVNQRGFLIDLENNHKELLVYEISTPTESDKVNDALLGIVNTYTSFEDMKSKYPIDNSNLLLVTTALLDFIY